VDWRYSHPLILIPIARTHPFFGRVMQLGTGLNEVLHDTVVHRCDVDATYEPTNPGFTLSPVVTRGQPPCQSLEVCAPPIGPYIDQMNLVARVFPNRFGLSAEPFEDQIELSAGTPPHILSFG
jgi:hypothetical protein